MQYCIILGSFLADVWVPREHWVQFLRTLAGRGDARVSGNEGVVETDLAVQGKGRDCIVNLNRLSGANESDGRSDEEGKHKKTKRPHDVV